MVRPRLPTAREPENAMADQLKIAVIGVGHLGKEHARVLSALDGVRLFAVVEPDEARGRAIAETHGCAWFAHHRELPDEVTAASIVAPTKMHFEIASSLLDRGLSVLVEKPMTRTLDE